MIITCHYHPPADLPIITLSSYQGRLIGLDWWQEKTEKLLKNTQQNTLNVLTTDELMNDDVNHVVLLTSIQQLDEYFAGKRQQFEIPLDLSFGTKFQQKVWQQLLNIPFGKTISYAQLANQIQQPKASRAVGNANGKNPISLIIPCHRVIASDGGLGGYTGGLAIKEYLLNFEKKCCETV